MSTKFTKEFYEHLYKCEEQSSALGVYSIAVDDDNPDLMWCQEFTKKVFNESEKQMLKDAMDKLYQSGRLSLPRLSSLVHIAPKRLGELLKEHDLYTEYKAKKYLLGGYILHHEGKQTLMFARTSAAARDYLKMTTNRSFAVRSVTVTSGRPDGTLAGHRIYRVPNWSIVFPNLSIDHEEVLNNEIIRIN